MSLVFGVILIAIAWLLSGFFDGLPDLWHVFSLVPTWLAGLIAVSIIAWFMGDS